MRQNKANIDSVSVTRATDTALHYADRCIKNAIEYMRDDESKKRKALSLCKFCYYINNEKIGGCSMTSRDCGICGMSQMYGSTNTDPLCLKCATDNQLCKECGADILLRPRRIYNKIEVEEPEILNSDSIKLINSILFTPINDIENIE